MANIKELQKGLKVGEHFLDGGREFVVDEVLQRGYISHLVTADEAKNKAVKEEITEEDKQSNEEEIIAETGDFEEIAEENNEETSEEDATEKETESEEAERDDSKVLQACDFEKLSKSELLEIAANYGLDVKSNMKKTEIIDLLLSK